MVSTDTLVLIDTRQGFSYWPGRFGTGHNAEFATYIVEMKKPLVVIVELKETWMGGVSQLSWSPGVSTPKARAWSIELIDTCKPCYRKWTSELGARPERFELPTTWFEASPGKAVVI
jgi:hypothetical protein